MLSSFGQINRLDCPLRVVVVRAGSDGQAMVCRSAPLYMAEVRVGKNIDGKKAVSAALERSFLARRLCLRRYQSETIANTLRASVGCSAGMGAPKRREGHARLRMGDGAEEGHDLEASRNRYRRHGAQDKGSDRYGRSV